MGAVGVVEVEVFGEVARSPVRRMWSPPRTGSGASRTTCGTNTGDRSTFVKPGGGIVDTGLMIVRPAPDPKFSAIEGLGESVPAPMAPGFRGLCSG